MSEKLSHSDIVVSSVHMEEVSQMEQLKPGDAIEFADIAELVTFEDIIAKEVDSNYDPALWTGRQQLRGLLRPAKFNGRIVDIKLIMMNKPYQRLLDANQRGWNVGGSSRNRTLRTNDAESLEDRYKGFIFIADARSTGRGSMGQIQTELWYYPVPPKVIKAGSIITGYNRLKSGEVRKYAYVSTKDRLERANGVDTKAINRVVAKPKIETEQFIRLDETARLFKFEALRQSMANSV